MDELLAIIGTPGVIPAVGAAAALAVSVSIWAVWRARVRAAKDTRRMYTSPERQQGFARSGGQCEYDRWLLFRCTRTAEHGDHFYPWSKGGATSMQNFVAACVRCNLVKSAHMPSPLMRARIQARRARYFPAGTPTTVGEWNRGRR